ncbi:MAG: stage 0 sporulation protein [Clostridia bacterium]|nr:stage 0 sporulation protein [Clostridia bacterium]
MQIEKVDVQFSKDSKPYSFSVNNLKLKKGDNVVVETARGLELGVVCNDPSFVENDGELKAVLRIATQKDIENKQENLLKQKEGKRITEEVVKKYNLDMKIVSLEYTLDRSRLLINFTSEDRVDFRELVKELATTFKSRIELRQIGSRDEAKVVGGLGPCGRQCCCNLFLNEYEHSSIKMAKVQNLSLNPTKISGLCGRLMCCLGYENEYYSETAKLMPKVNSMVKTPDGQGTVVYNNLLEKKVQVKFVKDGIVQEVKEYDLSEIKPVK